MGEPREGRLRVLVVDDEPTSREVLRLGVERQGYETRVAADAASAIALLSQDHFHAVITDKNMPGTDHPTEGGLDVIRYAKQINPGCAVLMMTAYATVESAIEAMRLGAFDYVVKPVRAEELQAKLGRVLQYQQTFDPAGVLSAYDGFRAEFLALLDGGGGGLPLDEARRAKLLAAIQGRIDGVFRERQEWERIIFEQREVLTRIAGWAAQLQETMPPDSEAAEVAAQILAAASHRI